MSRRRHGKAPTAHWVRQDRVPTPDELRWLASPQGREVCRTMAAGDPADTPAAIARWRTRLDGDLVTAAWMQVEFRAAARSKFTRADEMLFDRVGLEQSTDEVVAHHKAQRFCDQSKVADLCCGIGGDTLALSDGREVIAVDSSAARVAMAEHNAGVYGGRMTGLIGDVRLTMPDADAVHVDPDRRPAGRRRHQPDECSPGMGVLETIVSHYGDAAIKLSPGADFDRLPVAAEIELISHGGHCKQAVAWTGRFRTAHRRATALPEGETIAAGPGDSLDWPAPAPPRPGQFLLEPDPAVIRANLVGPLARRHGLAPIDPRIAWLVGDAPPARTALLQVFEIVEVIDFSIRNLRAALARHDVKTLEIKTRGFGVRPETILRQLKPVGQQPATVLLTRLGCQPVAILTRRRGFPLHFSESAPCPDTWRDV